MVQDLLFTAPFTFLSVMAIIAMVLDALIVNSSRITFIFSAITLLFSGILGISTFGLHGIGFNGMVTGGGFAAYFDILFSIGGLLTILTSRQYLQRENIEHDEFYSLVLFAVAGMMLIAHSNHLLILFIGIEVMSVSFYILSGYMRNNAKSVESSLKYFLLGAFATGFLVYGIALIYGSTGSMDYNQIALNINNNALNFPALLPVGVALIVIGLSFKAAAFPFHQWAPDVYQGAPTIVTAFMSTAGKAAAFAAFIPIVTVLMPSAPVKLQMIFAVMSAATMLIGNISALAQTNIKRMLAFSSVAHAGYIMMGLVSGSQYGYSGIVFYLTAYMFMQIGSFIIVAILERNGEKYLELSDYAGLSKRHPVLAAFMTIFMFSLAGIPPFAGFFGKYFLFTAAIDAGFLWLTLVGVLSSIISVYFYIGLIVKMYFTEPEGQREDNEVGMSGLSLIITIAGVIVLGILPSGILSIASNLFNSTH
ncbi:NADH-quinone oxidoreductase subunit N [Chlorobiota bacterium]|nr:NADH-quinone oxidoreductase subunit N [Chlorobiota bacterium]